MDISVGGQIGGYTGAQASADNYYMVVVWCYVIIYGHCIVVEAGLCRGAIALSVTSVVDEVDGVVAEELLEVFYACLRSFRITSEVDDGIVVVFIGYPASQGDVPVSDLNCLLIGVEYARLGEVEEFPLIQIEVGGGC